MKKETKINAHRFKIHKGLVNSGNGSRPSLMLSVKSKLDPGFSHLQFIHTLAKRERVKPFFNNSARMTEINMGPVGNAPVLKC